MKIVQILTKTVLIIPDNKCLDQTWVVRGHAIDEVHLPIEIWQEFRSSEAWRTIFPRLAQQFKVVLEGNKYEQYPKDQYLSTETMY